MRCACRVLLLSALPWASACRTAPPPAPDDARARELETRIARLEAQAKPVDLDDEILALEVERAGLLATYVPEHEAISRIDRRIEAMERSRAEEARARRARMLRRFEAERAEALVTYSADHDAVRRLDARIAFLRSDGR